MSDWGGKKEGIIMKNSSEIPDGWYVGDADFDAPGIIYSPLEAYDSEGDLYYMVEGICNDICSGEKVNREFTKSDLSEFEWRGWNPKGFEKRKKAYHKTFTVKFFINAEGEEDYNLLEREVKLYDKGELK